MSDMTEIAWADSTFNPWVGCQKISEGCDHCYAEADFGIRKRFAEWGAHAERRRTVSTWRDPMKWQKQAVTFAGKRGAGFPRMVFCASLCDVFDNRAPEGARADLWELIRKTPALDWLLLTKRPENIAKMLPADWSEGWPHVWLGTTAETQRWLDRRWPILASVPAAVRFISYEPALGPLTLGEARPDWILCGGENCAQKSLARTMDPQWARDLRDKCAAAGVSFFMKQMTNEAPIPADLFKRAWPSRKLENEAAA